jgi:hypothetical protein
MRSNPKPVLFVVCFMFCAIVAYPCGVTCIHCTLSGGPPQCPVGGCPSCTRSSSGACTCVLYQDGLPCQQFGTCYSGYNCLAPSLSRVQADPLKEKLPLETPSVVNPANHPWITSKTFIADLEKYSPDLARLVSIKQKSYLSGRYRHATVAKGIVDIGEPGNPRYEFFTIIKQGSTWSFAINQSRVEDDKRMEDEVKSPKEMLTIRGAEWKLQRGESGTHVVASGTIRE